MSALNQIFKKKKSPEHSHEQPNINAIKKQILIFLNFGTAVEEIIASDTYCQSAEFCFWCSVNSEVNLEDYVNV